MLFAPQRALALACEAPALIGNCPDLPQEQADALLSKGVAFRMSADDPNALSATQTALPLFEALSDMRRLAASLGNIGNIYIKLADYPEALKCHLQSLAVEQDIGDKSGIADSLSGIGSTLLKLGAFAQAERHLARRLAALPASPVALRPSPSPFALSPAAAFKRQASSNPAAGVKRQASSNPAAGVKRQAAGVKPQASSTPAASYFLLLEKKIPSPLPRPPAANGHARGGAAWGRTKPKRFKSAFMATGGRG